MNGAKIKTVKQEITRLVARIKELEAAELELKNINYSWGMLPRESGAVKRASMDLTRALAEMRKPG